MGNNYFSYCDSNPVNRWDPSGLADDTYSLARMYLDYYEQQQSVAIGQYESAQVDLTIAQGRYDQAQTAQDIAATQAEIKNAKAAIDKANRDINRAFMSFANIYGQALCGTLEITGVVYDVPYFQQGGEGSSTQYLCWAYCQVMVEAWASGTPNLTQADGDRMVNVLSKGKNEMGLPKIKKDDNGLAEYVDFTQWNLQTELMRGPMYIFTSNDPHMAVSAGYASATGFPTIYKVMDPWPKSSGVYYATFNDLSKNFNGMAVPACVN